MMCRVKQAASARTTRTGRVERRRNSSKSGMAQGASSRLAGATGDITPPKGPAKIGWKGGESPRTEAEHPRCPDGKSKKYKSVTIFSPGGKKWPAFS